MAADVRRRPLEESRICCKVEAFSRQFIFEDLLTPMEFWQWIAGSVIGLLSLAGIGKLLQMAYKAMLDRKAVQKALDQTNAGKEIDADVNAFNAINERLKLVEQRLDAVHDQLTEQKVENAKLEAENSRLTKENDRQEKEIERQRKRLHDLADNLQQKDGQILELKVTLERRQTELTTLRGELNNTVRDLNQLKREVESMHRKPDGHSNGDDFTQE